MQGLYKFLVLPAVLWIALCARVCGYKYIGGTPPAKAHKTMRPDPDIHDNQEES